jgi:hypothetical protein
MQYMLLLYADENAGMALPQAEMAAWMDKMNAYADALRKAGAHVAHGALGPSTTASVVNLQNGEMRVHDGPFSEAKEQIGGYYMIDVASRDEANRWAAKCPAAIWGHVEVREVAHAD